MQDINCFIIKSHKPQEKNWSGKEFSCLPAKIYFSFQDAFDALNQYWYGSGNADDRIVKIVPLLEEGKKHLLDINAIRL